jgi:hypothetical protein
MSGRSVPACVALALLVAVLTGVSPTGQSSFEPPRTPWGDPDLQGLWPTAPLNTIPFERPPAFGTRATLSDEEVQEREAQLQRQQAAVQAERVVPGGRGAVAPPAHWLEAGRVWRQTSLIVDPPDGRLPEMTEDGARRAKTWAGPTTSYFAGPEDFNPYDRCITRGVLGSTFPNIYSAGIEILQTPGLVVIRYEMVHETRIVPLDGRPHISERIRSYMGDPRGRWEGETLVIETTNFNGRTGSYARNANGNPTSEALRLVERFRLSSADTLRYEVTVEDPLTWVRPWTVAFEIPRDPDYYLHEYACHEGNYALANMLRASREADRQGR